jgi:hypothetical protein
MLNFCEFRSCQNQEGELLPDRGRGERQLEEVVQGHRGARKQEGRTRFEINTHPARKPDHNSQLHFQARERSTTLRFLRVAG